MVGDPGREPTPTTGTLPHRQLHDLLVDLGFDVEDEYAVGRFSLDCYVAELHLGFEADGRMWHGGVQRRRDEARDREIETTYGIPVLRMKDYMLNRSVEAEARLDQFIDEHADTSEQRRQIARGLL